MCLITNNGVYIADKDIECYKILKLDSDLYYAPYTKPNSNCFIRSPYQRHHIITNRYLTTDMTESFNKVSHYENDSLLKVMFNKLFKKETPIFIGLHSYQKLNDIIQNLNIWDGEFIVRCIIPKGTKYIKGCAGTFDTHNNKIIDKDKDIYHYASETLILGDIISNLGDIVYNLQECEEIIIKTYSLIK